MIKSAYSLDGPNYDKFPLNANNIDVNTNDGEEIVALFEFADRILQFKQNTMYVINVSGASEFLESTHSYKGIPHTGCACKTDYGIAWANQYGCYLYDGKQVIDLIEEKGIRKISESTWSTHMSISEDLDKAHNIGTHDFCHVGYYPKKKELLVTAGAHTSFNGYVYNFITKAWVYTTSLEIDGNPWVPLVTSPVNGKLLHASQDTNKIYKWSGGLEHTTDQTIILKTKDIDFGEPAVRKKIYKVYLSYKGTGQNVTVGYRVNGETTASLGNFYRITSATDGSSSNATDSTKPLWTGDVGTTDWLTAELKPVTSINNVYSFQLVIGGTCGSSNTFEINDITIVYRAKGIK